MSKTVGLWIDHRQAVIVFVMGKEEETKLIHSKVEHSHGRSGASDAADDSTQKVSTEHLNHYYDEVISSLQNAEAMLIMGPGEAKGELKKRIELKALPGRVIELETADKMTDRQIVAKVREHFLKHGQAVGSR